MGPQKAKHTPGPWRVEDQRKAISRWVIVTGEGGSVAECAPAGPWVSNETADANARLIAAAPDLLEAAKMALEMYRQLQPVGGWQAVHDFLHAAIAKAEGGAA